MTRSFAVDQHNDLMIGNNRKLALVDNLQAVMAICTHAAQAILGEMIYAQKQGLPDFQTVWQRHGKLPIAHGSNRYPKLHHYNRFRHGAMATQ